MKWLVFIITNFFGCRHLFLIIQAFAVFVFNGYSQSLCESDIKQHKQLPANSHDIQYIDSLHTCLQKATKDSSRASIYLELAKRYVALKYDSAIFYADKALHIAQNIKHINLEVNALICRGNVEEVSLHNWDSAQRIYRQALDKAIKYKLVYKLDELYSIIHNAYYYQGNFPQAMQIANEALQWAEKKNNLLQKAHYNLLIASAYFNQHLTDLALASYKKAEAIITNDKFDEASAKNLVTVADVYYGMGNAYAAKEVYDTAIIYLDKALHKFKSYQNYNQFNRNYMIANTYWRKGEVYASLKNFPVAFEFARQALQQCSSNACNLYEKVNYYLLAGKSALASDNHQVAKQYFLIAHCISIFNNHAENKRDVAFHLASSYATEGKYDSAYIFLKQFLVLKDSISNERSRYRTQEINTIFRLAEKDRKIARQHNFRNILISSFALVLITIGFLYNRYRLRQKNFYQKEINRQQTELFNAIAAAQEQERKRIAQDLHDSLGSILSAARLKFTESRDSKPQLQEDEKFLTGINLLDEASTELRNISHNIMPATLSKLGLVPALRNLTEKISSRRGLQINFIAHDFETRLQEQIEISIYRIILELINNIVKHAFADKASVQLIRYPDYINIIVEDSGKGFESGIVGEERSGIGLGSVAARVDYLKGKMEIDSTPGKGTTVIIEIPVK